jgi:hypothetical protein
VSSCRFYCRENNHPTRAVAEAESKVVRKHAQAIGQRMRGEGGARSGKIDRILFVCVAVLFVLENKLIRFFKVEMSCNY